jgi:hypothetical protein
MGSRRWHGESRAKATPRRNFPNVIGLQAMTDRTAEAQRQVLVAQADRILRQLLDHRVHGKA